MNSKIYYVALFLVPILCSLFSYENLNAQSQIQSERESVFIKNADNISRPMLLHKNERSRIFNSHLSEIQQRFSTSKIDIIRRHLKGVRFEKADSEIDTIREYYTFILQLRSSSEPRNKIFYSNNETSSYYDFDSGNWTIRRNPSEIDDEVNTDGEVNIINSNVVKIIGPDEGRGGDINYTIEIEDDGLLEFDWNYFSTDEEATFDRAYYSIDYFGGSGTFVLLATNEDSPANGKVQVNVEDGKELGFRVLSQDGLGGAGELTISNLQVTDPNVPVASFDKSIEDYGLTITNETKIANLLIENSGGDDLVIDAINPPSGSDLSVSHSSGFTLEPQSSQNVTFTFTPQSQNFNYNETISISHNASGSPFLFSLTANVVNEGIFIITEFDQESIDGLEFLPVSTGGITGQITHIFPDFILDESIETLANDLTILITSGPSIESERLLQIGGDNILSANNYIEWENGDDPNPGTRVSTTVELNTPFNVSSTSIWIGHGFNQQDPSPSATWSGRIALYDTEALNQELFTNNRINDEGWYIFSTPKVYTSVTELLAINENGGLWTQCFDGAEFDESSFCDNIPAGQTTRSNVITYNGEGNIWQAVESADGLIPPGTAIATYVYETQDPLGSQAATDFGSFSIDLNGFPFINDLTVNIAQDQFKLLGNPYDFSIDLQNVTSGDFNNITGIVYRLNDGATGYDTYDVTAPSGSFEINTFDGFFVDSDGSNSSFTFSTSLGDPTKQQPLAEEPAFVHLHLENEYVSARTSFRIVEDAGPHRLGARYLAPPVTPNISMVSHFDDDRMIVRYLPSGLTDDLTIPISINSRYKGSVMMRPEITTSVPADWGFVLFDHLTGNRYNLRDQNLPEIEIRKTVVISERFELYVTPLSDEIGGAGLPSDFALAQNYPNPFNPATTIQYELPQDTEVRLDVYSIEGRQITTLVNNTQQAGRHNVSFDASNLASGIYIYRLQAGQQVLTRKMVLLK